MVSRRSCTSVLFWVALSCRSSVSRPAGTWSRSSIQEGQLVRVQWEFASQQAARSSPPPLELAPPTTIVSTTSTRVSESYFYIFSAPKASSMWHVTFHCTRPSRNCRSGPIASYHGVGILLKTTHNAINSKAGMPSGKFGIKTPSLISDLLERKLPSLPKLWSTSKHILNQTWS